MYVLGVRRTLHGVEHLGLPLACSSFGLIWFGFVTGAEAHTCDCAMCGTFYHFLYWYVDFFVTLGGKRRKKGRAEGREKEDGGSPLPLSAQAPSRPVVRPS